jgi:putative copper export protein
LIEAGLITARFLHFAMVMALFGLALFPLYGNCARVGEPPQLTRWLRVSLRCAALLALLSAMPNTMVSANTSRALLECQAVAPATTSAAMSASPAIIKSPSAQ